VYAKFELVTESAERERERERERRRERERERERMSKRERAREWVKERERERKKKDTERERKRETEKPVFARAMHSLTHELICFNYKPNIKANLIVPCRIVTLYSYKLFCTI
jgi:hypothetical protein